MNEKKKIMRGLPKRILSFVLTLAMVLTLMPMMSVEVKAAGNPTTWKELQEAINDVPDYDWEAEEPVKITLGADIIANHNDEFLEVGNYDQFDATKNKEIYVKIDLNGYKIDRCLTQATEEGYVIKIGNYSILEIEDSSQAKTGKITGGYNDGDGGGICCGAYSELRLYSGSICGNKATGAGGGVFEFAKCWFTMYGGSIQNNESNNDYGGGAIGLNYCSKANLYGGVISGNKTDSGCAFSFDEDTDFSFGGTIQITGNTTNGVERNFDFDKLYHASIDSEKPLTTNAQIGIYAEQPPRTGTFWGLTDDNVQYIKSDKTGYECSCPENGSLRIAKKTHKWTYAKSGNQLTATCDKGCDEKITHTATLSLSASDANYSGSKYTGASITGLETFNNATKLNVNTEQITYYKVDTAGATTGGTQKTAAEVGKTPGSYYAAITVEGATAVKSFSIGKITPVAADFTYTAPQNLAYDGTVKSATVTVKSGVSGMGNIIAVKYYNASGELTEPKAPGTYTVKITVSEGTNYNAVTDLYIGTFTILAHVHQWEFTTPSADTLKAHCGNGGHESVNDVVLVLTAASKVHDGKAVTADFVSGNTTLWEMAGLTVPTITYEAKTGSFLTDGKAVNVGSYTAKASYTVGGDTYTITKDFAITPKPQPKTGVEDVLPVWFAVMAVSAAAYVLTSKKRFF